MPEIVAYHEAGHALMALLLGGKVKHATIEPDDDDELLRLCFGWVVPFNLAVRQCLLHGGDTRWSDSGPRCIQCCQALAAVKGRQVGYLRPLQMQPP